MIPDQAQARAQEKLLRALLGNKWKIKVWENLGWWYCSAYKGPIEIFQTRAACSNEFTAAVKVGLTTWFEEGVTPFEAMQNVVGKVYEDIAETKSVAEEARQIVLDMRNEGKSKNGKRVRVGGKG